MCFVVVAVNVPGMPGAMRYEAGSLNECPRLLETFDIVYSVDQLTNNVQGYGRQFKGRDLHRRW